MKALTKIALILTLILTIAPPTARADSQVVYFPSWTQVTPAVKRFINRTIKSFCGSAVTTNSMIRMVAAQYGTADGTERGDTTSGDHLMTAEFEVDYGGSTYKKDIIKLEILDPNVLVPQYDRLSLRGLESTGVCTIRV
ncbi:MAG: hypothetical protein HN509_09260 [Halobacteriovoraceae bacterium]|jgi:hypothetical protein|nr:hypothetical protein [Halobacteriovoraceae bacterium]